MGEEQGIVGQAPAGGAVVPFARVPSRLQRKQIDRRLRAVVTELGALAQAASDANEWPLSFELAELAVRVTQTRVKVTP